MRILITADLHYDLARSRGPTQQLAKDALAAGGDVLVLVGDTAGRDVSVLQDCLRLFAGFGGSKLLVPGNHCLWCNDGESSLDRYERIVPEVAAREGFQVLDHDPLVRGGVALVGSVGWYDCSFRYESLGIPLAFYQAKVSPGAAARLDGYEDLLEAHRAKLTDRQLGIVTRWMDGRFVRLGMSDEAFVAVLAERLDRQLAELDGMADQIIVFLHHVPFRELVPQGRPDGFAFAAAYMGSERLGQVLLGWPKITHVYCGHTHWPCRQRIAHLDVIGIGSTYTSKNLELLEL